MVLAVAAEQFGSAGARPGAQVVAWTADLKLPGVVTAYDQDEEVFAEEDEAASIYHVVSGVVRIVRLLGDGRRHIASFHFPGETFGLEIGDTHNFAAEAVTPCRIASIRRSEIARHLDGAATGSVWRLMAAELRRTQEHSLLLGRLSACERVAAFIRDMAARGAPGGPVDLPMSRTDIADYLGLTIETVSRTFTLLQKQGAIGIHGARRIFVRQPAALAAA